MEQNKRPEQFQNDQEWEEAIKGRFEGLHTKLAELIGEARTLQAKCDRYEAALKKISIRQPIRDMKGDDVTVIIGYWYDLFIRVAREALSAGEGQKVPEVGKIIVRNNSEAFRYWTANIKGYRIAHKGHATVVWLPEGMTSEIFAKEWGEYENANNPTNQKEDKQ